MSDYVSAHTAVKRIRGRASSHECAECGRWPARDWAYDHEDQNAERGDLGMYSLDPAHYRPLCRPCHLRFDQSEPYILALAYLLNEPCPKCGALPGRFCTSPAGYRRSGIKTQHPVRRQAVEPPSTPRSHDERVTDSERWTTSEAAAHCGLVPGAFRTLAAKNGLYPVARRPGLAGENLWDVAEVKAMQAARPGQGYRSDKHMPEREAS